METMKSMFFACALLLGSAEAFSAENLVLSEDFESQTFPPSGWVVKGTELSEDLTEVESVSLEGLASGMYIVSVSCGDSVSTARVMKR